MKIGFIGLGNMGLNMVKNLIDHEHKVLAWNRSEAPRLEAQQAGAQVFDSIKELVQNLDTEPKIIISMIAAGSPVDKILFENGENSISTLLNKGDIFIDGVNSYYKDSVKRANKLNEKGIIMLDAGISGGTDGARNGACAMIGGNKEAFKHVEQIFKDITVENGYGYFGKSGAGHFVKMVHNAIEYGMMQVIGEGLNLIDEAEEYSPEITKLLDVWNHGSIIESKLIGFLHSALSKENLQNLDIEIGSLGTGRWAAEDALERGVPFTGISHAVFNRYSSRGTSNIAFKVIQAMRAEFGAHTSHERDAK